jgi:hypothetical protein
MRTISYLLIFSLLFSACRNSTNSKMESIINKTIDSLVSKYGQGIKTNAEKGIKQAAHLWTSEDGTIDEFYEFCISNYIGNDSIRDVVFKKLNDYFEATNGNFNQMLLQLQRQVHLDVGPILPIDEMFSSFDPSSHIDDDLFANKIAFYIIMNFPKYSLKEKNKLGEKWDMKQWAYARMGDLFDSRVPAKLQQDISTKLADADLYISQYNIYAGKLLNNENKSLFPQDMKLLSHWNIRDEIKANYGKEGGLEKQDMLYQVMKRIIYQEIPSDVIDNDKFQWNPITNKVYSGGKEVESKPEQDIRYKKILGLYAVNKSTDKYYTDLDNYIKRSFDGNMEMSQEDVEKLFTDFLSSKQVKEVAALIKKRLGRELKPYDIWYDGFKTRSTISNEELDNKAKKKYPSNIAFKNDIPAILQSLGFDKQKSDFIASKIDVDAARGSGHAWGAAMHSMNSHLRTRIEKDGMNYKGFNISMHEFGHTVEQTISMHDVDYYVLSGVPNTAFTEALAFVFQRRDLDMLGIKDNNPEKEYLTVLDNFWSLYEIMGVSLVDMQVWKWMYAHPQATPAELKTEVIKIAIDVWNKYYAEPFGDRDAPILAIYSHMVSYPLYLSNYAVGYLIDFQLEQQFKGKNFGSEVNRIFSQGRLTPKEWMLKATGKEISNEPILESVDEALKHLIK